MGVGWIELVPMCLLLVAEGVRVNRGTKEGVVHKDQLPLLSLWRGYRTFFRGGGGIWEGAKGRRTRLTSGSKRSKEGQGKKRVVLARTKQGRGEGGGQRQEKTGQRC